MSRMVIVMIVASILAIYLTILNVKYPLIGIDVVENKNGDIIVNDIYEFGWAEKQNIHVNDQVLKVDGEPPLSHFTVRKYKTIEQAKTITIQRENQIQMLTVDYRSNGAKQWLYYIALPAVFFLFTVSLSIFLLRLWPHDKAATVLIYFLLLIGLCYISASLSAKYALFGRQMFNGIFLILPAVFLHFVHHYFEKEKKLWFTNKIIFSLYGFNFVMFVVSLMSLSFRSISEAEVLLTTFFINMVIILALLGKGLVYLKKDEQQNTVKGLFFAIGLSVAPFILFYSLPVLIIGKWVLPAELTVTSLFVLPSVFLYLICTDRLFQLQFSINHFVYYAFLSLLPSFLVTLLYIKFVNEARGLVELALLFLLIYVINILALYLKGCFDRTLRTKLYVQKDFYQESIYRIGEALKKQKNMQEVIQCLEKEVSELLAIEELAFVQPAIKNMQAPFQCDEKEWMKLTKKMDRKPLSIGKIIENKRLFAVFVGSFRQGPLLLIGKKKHPIPFTAEQTDWLSTIVYYTSITIENMAKVEDLIKELDNLKESRNSIWLTRLIFQWSEKERRKLSIDLHDTILQDLIVLKRKVESLRVQNMRMDEMKKQLSDIEEEIVDIIDLTREICHELRPPFLSQIGLKEAIVQLIQRFQLRANIKVEWNVHLLAKLEEEQELAIYRIIQELLNNALKHSQASYIKLTLETRNEEIQLHYMDNGIGMDMKTLRQDHRKLGLFGIKERVQGLGGTYKMTSQLGEGLDIRISIPL
ncbi:ATP-binding protein [Parageobacillus sp. G301]|jgi:two-component system, NarL family, sensor histidine kinase ComP|uniref:ATP-binding protein n=1 Tax=Parageobacillus sp. G301 TaxID=2998290 RepID=UPI002496719D|nr:ATP-binding protein [Parageobacillus sp. G301]GLH65460.1 ATPase [Parageobacillus sp. G301]